MLNKKLPLTTKRPAPVLVVDLFPSLQAGLVELLTSLTNTEWKQPIRYSTWTVKDVALHLLGGEIGNLSRRRDGYLLPAKSVQTWGDRVSFINDINDQWLVGARRISPRLMCDLLTFIAPQLFSYFKSLDPFALGAPVSWAGSEPVPIWLDIAREYTERWYHQQQIRDAVGKPGFKQSQYFAPVLATFIRALPKTFETVSAAEGTIVALILTGDSGETWCVSKEGQSWSLYAGMPSSPDAQVSLDQDIAWRLFTKGMSKEEARTHAFIGGDEILAMKMFDMVSIIA